MSTQSVALDGFVTGICLKLEEMSLLLDYPVPTISTLTILPLSKLASSSGTDRSLDLTGYPAL